MLWTKNLGVILVWSTKHRVAQHRMSKHYYGGTLIPRTVFESKSEQGLVLGIPGVVLPAKHLSQEQHRCDLFR